MAFRYWATLLLATAMSWSLLKLWRNPYLRTSLERKVGIPKESVLVERNYSQQNETCDLTVFSTFPWDPTQSEDVSWKAMTLVQSTIHNRPSGFAARCDWVIGLRWYFDNAYGHFNILPRVVFVNAWNLQKFHENVLPCIPAHHQIVLIIGDEDVTCPKQVDVRYPERPPFANWANWLEDPRIKHMFVSHLDTISPPERVTPIPLGLNPEEGHPNEALKTAQIEPSTKISIRPLRLLFTNRVRSGTGQWSHRKQAQDMCKELSHCDVMEADTSAFLQRVQQYPFLLCVHGGGIDPNPNLVSALLAGSIPIIMPFAGQTMYDGWPVIIINETEWNGSSKFFSKEYLQSKRLELAPFFEDPLKREEMLEKLTSKYWWKKVQLQVDSMIIAHDVVVANYTIHEPE